jgi:CobQ/CobB/MinD/ParA nucleotide binding domain
MGGKGGVGKTLALVAITDYLYSKNSKLALVDCDTENAQQSTCFNHWLGGKAVTLNLRHPLDRDRLLSDSAGTDAQFVLVDLPGNSTGDLSVWLQDVATLDLIEEMGLGIIAVGAATPQAGSAASVVKWITTLGDRATYLVVLNRQETEVAPQPIHKTFSEWFDVAVPMLVPGIVPKDKLYTIEMPNMEFHAMEALRKFGKLPSRVLKDPAVHALIRKRIKTWRDRIFPQLEATGLFVTENVESLVQAK